MQIRSMRVEVALDQPINKENSYATIGGFSFRYANSTTINFDFENSEGWIQPKGNSLVFELSSLDEDCSCIPNGMTAEKFVCPIEVVEFYHEFLNDAKNDAGTILMTGILWWTFEIDGREYSVPKEVLQQYNHGELKSINNLIRKDLK